MAERKPRRVVITGMGVVTPVGLGWPAMWQALLERRSGVRVLEGVDLDGLPTRIGAQVRDFDPSAYMDRRDARRMDRFAQFAVAATRMALEDAGLDLTRIDRERAGVVIGTGIGGIHTLCEQHQVLLTRGPERVSPFFIPMMIGNMAAGQIAILFGLKGPNETLVTACTSSANALGEAFRLIQRGDADVMVTGGTEAALNRLALAGFCAMKALSTRNDRPQAACRPFDRQRDGFVMAEGAGALIIESLDHARERRARVYAEVLGYGMSADAYHVVEPPPDGEGAVRSMRRALADAGLRPQDIGYINAHATSTPKGDLGETLAVKQVFGDLAHRVPISSTKSMTGHLLGAAGAVEAIITALALHEQILPPTINLEEPDPECDLDYVADGPRPASFQAAMTNSFGFGGQNATLILGRVEP